MCTTLKACKSSAKCKCCIRAYTYQESERDWNSHENTPYMKTLLIWKHKNTEIHFSENLIQYKILHDDPLSWKCDPFGRLTPKGKKKLGLNGLHIGQKGL